MNRREQAIEVAKTAISMYGGPSLTYRILMRCLRHRSASWQISSLDSLYKALLIHGNEWMSISVSSRSENPRWPNYWSQIHLIRIPPNIEES